MKGLFKSRFFKIICAVLVLLIVTGAAFSAIKGSPSPGNSAGSAVLSPIQKFMAGIGNNVHDVLSVYSERDKLRKKNKELQQQVDSDVDNQIKMDKLKAENDSYKNFLGIKEDNPDFKLEPATLISSDNSDPFHTFTIDKGLLNGISANDPVITPEGLIGYITEVTPTSAKVITILNPALNVGGMDSRTRDIGSTSGGVQNAENNTLTFNNLKRESTITQGDIVITYGHAGIFPRGLKIGTVSAINQGNSDVSLDVTVKPFVDFSSIKSMMVITSFAGQGDIVNN